MSFGEGEANTLTDVFASILMLTLIERRRRYPRNGMNGNSTVAAAIARDLAAYGARRCFGLLGTANFKISHALVGAGVELISARHEGNAASMADAYAKATGELTLVSVHSGPGLTNAITGIAEAAKSRTPLVVLAGDVANGAVKSNFYIDQAELVRSVGAVSERIHTPRSAREDALRAVTRALHDRRTVVLSLPADVQDAELATNSGPLELPPATGRLHPDPEAVGRLADAMARAQRPLILGGRGAVLSDAEAGAACARRPHRRVAGDDRVRSRTVRRQPVVARHLRRLRLADCGRAHRRERSRRRVRRELHAMDDQARQADRARRDRRPDRRGGIQSRLPDAGPACDPWRRAR